MTLLERNQGCAFVAGGMALLERDQGCGFVVGGMALLERDQGCGFVVGGMTCWRNCVSESGFFGFQKPKPVSVSLSSCCL